MKLLYCVCLFFIGQTALSQNLQLIDSLQELQSHQQGIDKIKSLVDLSHAFIEASLDESLSAAEQALNLLENSKLHTNSTKYKLLEADIKNAQGEAYMQSNNYDLARESFLKAYQSYLQADNQLRASVMADNIGYIARVMGNNEEALHYLNYSFHICDSLNLNRDAAITLNDLAGLYYNMGEIDKAMNYFKRAKLFYEKVNDSLSMAECDNNIAVLYIDLGNYRKAEEMLNAVILFLARNPDAVTLGNAHHNLGLIYSDYNIDYDKALDYFYKALALRREAGDSLAVCENQIELGNVLLKQGKIDEAIKWYKKALNLSELIHYQSTIISANLSLGIAYYQNSNFEKSKSYLINAQKMNSESEMAVNRDLITKYLILNAAKTNNATSLETQLQILLDDYDALSNKYNALLLEKGHSDYDYNLLFNDITQIEKQLNIQNRKILLFRYAFAALSIILLSLVLVMFFIRKK